MSKTNWRIGKMNHLESPWGNAGGVVKKIEDVESMAKTGVGWIEAGSYTLEKRYGNHCDSEGNEKIDPRTNEIVKVYYHDHLTGETVNSLGMPNQGMDQLEDEIPEMIQIASAYGKELVFNVAPVTTDPVTETKELVSRAAAAGARRIILNLSCPNVIGEAGGPHEPLSHHPQKVGAVARGLIPIANSHRDLDLYARTSPDKSYHRAKLTYRQIGYSGVFKAIWVTNTWPLSKTEQSPLGVAGGGRSGSSIPLIHAADEQLTGAVEILNGSKIDIVMSTSIRNSRRLKQCMELGAVAGAGTTFYYEASENWQEATDRLLRGLVS